MMIHEVLNLLGVSNVKGDPQQLAKLCFWIEGLVNTNGKDYIIKNRETLLKQWDHTLSMDTSRKMNKG